MREISPHDLRVGHHLVTADGDPVGVVKRLAYRTTSSSSGPPPRPGIVVTFPSGIEAWFAYANETRLFIAQEDTDG